MMDNQTIPASNTPIAYSYRRFSTPDQIKGDSIRRQTELSDNWCERNGINLDTNLSIEDLGVSAFDSSNIEKGNLGAFFEAVKRGKVPRGSYLLVESLDRLSRADVFTALKLFINILDEGIIIVTLGDDMEYSQERIANNNWTDLIISLTIMSRANEESKTKSKRLKASAVNKREKARNGQILTKNCPQWIKFNPETQEFELIPDRVEIVQKILKLSSTGIGSRIITDMLNDEQIPSFGKTDHWVKGNVASILRSRTVIGEFQPHERMNKHNKREPRGEPIKGYYPAAVTEELFNTSGSAMSKRRTRNSSGRKGKNFTNIFNTLTKCPYCSSTSVVQTKKRTSVNSPDVQYKSVCCAGNRTSKKCTSAGLDYDLFEKEFLNRVPDLDINSIITFEEKAQDHVNEIRNAIRKKNSAYEDNKKKLKKFTQLFITSDDLPETLIQEMRNLEEKQKEITLSIQLDRSNIQVIQDDSEKSKSAQKDIKDITTLMNTLKGAELYKTRAKLHQRICNIIEKVYFYTRGNPTLDNDNSKFAIIKFKGSSDKFYRLQLKNGTTNTVNIENAIYTGGEFLPYPECWND